MEFIVAIDGPTSSGKSSVANLITRQLNYKNIQTGAMFRCIAYQMLKENVRKEEIHKIKRILKNTEIEFINSQEKQEIYLNKRNVTEQIRSKVVTDYTSEIASIIEIRDSLMFKQRQMARNNQIVMEGRDIGTRIFPNADIKFYLTANPKIRAIRKMKELEKNGEKIEYIEALRSIYKWDYDAIKREIGGLKRPKGSILIDTTNLEVKDLKNLMIKQILEKYTQKTNRIKETSKYKGER